MIGPVGLAETISTWIALLRRRGAAAVVARRRRGSRRARRRYQSGASQRLTKPGPAISARSTCGSARRRAPRAPPRSRAAACRPRAGEPHRDVRRVVAVRRLARPLERDGRARRLAERRLEPLDRLAACLRVVVTPLCTGVDEDDPGQERQLNIQIDEKHLAGVYANFANISFSELRVHGHVRADRPRGLGGRRSPGSSSPA